MADVAVCVLLCHVNTQSIFQKLLDIMDDYLLKEKHKTNRERKRASMPGAKKGGTPTRHGGLHSLIGFSENGGFLPTLGAFILSLDSMSWEHSFSPWIQ